MGRRGRDRVGALFTFEAQASQYLRLFNDLHGTQQPEARTDQADHREHALPLVS
jgi:hypothetical protein